MSVQTWVHVQTLVYLICLLLRILLFPVVIIIIIAIFHSNLMTTSRVQSLIYRAPWCRQTNTVTIKLTKRAARTLVGLGWRKPTCVRFENPLSHHEFHVVLTQTQKRWSKRGGEINRQVPISFFLAISFPYVKLLMKSLQPIYGRYLSTIRYQTRRRDHHCRRTLFLDHNYEASCLSR